MFWKRSDFNTGKKIRVWKFEGRDSGIGRIWIQERNLEFGNWEVGCSGIGRIWIQEKKFRVWKFGGGGDGGVLESQNPKCQDLAKFPFLEEGGVLWNQIPEQGCSEQFGQKILEA